MTKPNPPYRRSELARHPRASMLCAIACGLLGVLAKGGTLAVASGAAQYGGDASRALNAAVDEVWRTLLERSVDLQSSESPAPLGLPELTAAANDRARSADERLLATLRAMSVRGLSLDQELTRRILDWYLLGDARDRRYYWLQFAITPYRTYEFGPIHDLLAGYPLATRQNRAGYLALLDAYARQLGERLAKTRAQSARGIDIPRAALPGVAATYRALAEGCGEQLAVRPERLAALDPSSASAFRSVVRRRIDTRVRPALLRIAEYAEDPVRRAAAPDRVGLAQYPGGREYYRQLMRRHTTLDLTPDEIFEYGERRMAELQTEMAQVRSALGFSGSHADFAAELYRRPELMAATPDALGIKYLSYIERIRPLLPKYFARLPSIPYAVRRLDLVSEAGMTFGFYQEPTPDRPIGEYRYNGSNLGDKLTIGAGSLIFHELMPGHHMEVAMAFENPALPPIRRKALDFTAYSEGWADYAAALGAEMGLLDDPYDHYGRLADEAFTVARLVLDVGLNDRGWTLERGRRYFRDNTLIAPGDINMELLRYATDIPGQALGYRIGQRWFDETRARMQRELGSRFDLREFHSLMLAHGNVPLAILNEVVRRALLDQGGVASAPQDSKNF